MIHELIHFTVNSNFNFQLIFFFSITMYKKKFFTTIIIFLTTNGIHDKLMILMRIIF